MTEPPSEPITTWRHAEASAIRWLRDFGYPDAAPAPDDSPPGVDVRATWALAQVRFGDAAVRRSDLQQLAAARADASDVALFAFTASRFELPAITYADTKGIRLFSYADDGGLIPRNENARAVLGATGAPARTVTPDIFTVAPVLRWAPLVVASYLVVITLLQVARAASGVVGIGDVLLPLTGALAFGAMWYFGTRRLGRRKPGRTDRQAPPGDGRAGPPR